VKIRDFPLFADENIFRQFVLYLRSENFDVRFVREESFIGWKDADLLPIAFKEKRVVVTQDNDFGQIVFTKKVDFVGIIYLRPGHFPADKTIQTFQAILFQNPDLEPPFVLTAHNKGDTIRIKVRNAITP
jgi:predicted nuclease of predicted toxin-antitoxin system